MLDAEIYSDNSCIWDPDFKQAPPKHLPAALESKGHQVRKTGEFEKVTVPQNEKDNFTTINISPGMKKIQEKRPNSERRPDVKRRKTEDTFEDLPDDTIVEIIASINETSRLSGYTVFSPELARDETAKTEENKKIIEFHMVGNSLTRPVSKQTMLWLIGLQDVFIHQLPKTPRDYITQLLFDP